MSEPTGRYQRVLSRKTVIVDPPGGLGNRLQSALAELYGIRFVDPGTDRADAALLLPGADAAFDGDRLKAVFDARVTDERRHRFPSSVRFSNEPDVPQQFRNTTFADAAGGDTALTVAEGDVVLAASGRAPLWTVRRSSRGFRTRVAVAPPTLASGLLRDEFRPGRALALLPLLAFLASLTESSANDQPLPATIIVDDPNLHRVRYGYLDFRGILNASQQTEMHVAMAMIPLDTWYANPSAVESFSDPRGTLSLLVHGNNHRSRELARPTSDPIGLALLVQALHRVTAFEQRTGLSVSRTMAAPHGACSRASIRRLARAGFGALTISRPHPWTTTPGETDVLIGARAVEPVDGLPLVLRTHVHDLDHLPFSTFLGQPAVVYGHHWDWPGGAKDLAETARAVSRVTRVRWGPIDKALNVGVTLVCDGKTAEIELSARAAIVEIPDGATSITVSGRHLHPSDTLLVDGSPLEPDALYSVSGERSIRLELDPSDAVGKHDVGRPSGVAIAVARRALTETRDRLTPVSARTWERARRARKQHREVADGDS